MRCGSFAEGMTNHGDIDDMHILDGFLVVEHSDNIPEKYKGTVLLLKPDQCEPGYTRLELYRNTPDNPLEIYSNQDGKLYLDWIKFLEIKLCPVKFEEYKIDMHGTAFQLKPNADLVVCFHCPVWPALARRKFQNNDQNFKAEIIRRDGCHIVPVAHPKSKHRNLEFRISFPAAEKYLTQNWNKSQMNIYYLCKELCNKFLKTGQDLEKCFCSYFTKTILFWMVERYSKAFWTENSTLSIVGQFINDLRTNITGKSCPNYFVPNNLMMSTYTDKQVNSLLSRLEDVSTDMFYSIISCDTFISCDLEMLPSLYKTITLAGDQLSVTEILTSVYQEQYLHLNVRKKIYRHRFTHLYFLQFISMFWREFLFEVSRSICAGKYQEVCRTEKRLNELSLTIMDGSCLLDRCLLDRYLPDSYLLQCANMHLNRCLTMSVYLPDLFHAKGEETELKKQLWKITEWLFVSSMDVPGELSDGAFNGRVYLGLFYYLTNHIGKSLLILPETLDQGGDHWRLVPMMVIAKSTIPYEIPSFFRNDEILWDLFEKWHLHEGFNIDPSFLRFYLIYRITKDKNCLNFLKIDNKICDSEASNYIRYRLGLFPKGSDDFAKYSKEKDFCCCSFFPKYSKRTLFIAATDLAYSNSNFSMSSE